MKLPYHHVFAARKFSNKPLFDEGLCEDRWRMERFKNSHQVFNNSKNDPGEITVVNATNMPVKLNKPLSEQEKYWLAFKALQPLAVSLSDFGTKEFFANMNVIREIQAAWTRGEKVNLAKCCENDDKVMLSWFVDERQSENAMKEGKLIEEEAVLTINQIEKYFTFDGWKCV
eukprot:gene4095-4650_t